MAETQAAILLREMRPLAAKPLRTTRARTNVTAWPGRNESASAAAAYAVGSVGSWGATGARRVGLLDELEQEAQKRKANADNAEKRKVDRDEVFRTQLDPAMTALYEY